MSYYDMIKAEGQAKLEYDDYRKWVEAMYQSYMDPLQMQATTSGFRASDHVEGPMNQRQEELIKLILAYYAEKEGGEIRIPMHTLETMENKHIMLEEDKEAGVAVIVLLPPEVMAGIKAAELDERQRKEDEREAKEKAREDIERLRDMADAEATVRKSKPRAGGSLIPDWIKEFQAPGRDAPTYDITKDDRGFTITGAKPGEFLDELKKFQISIKK